jgi:hypothetical protein
MRVKTKYGYGTLIGIDAHPSFGGIGYKVLLDNIFDDEFPEDERMFNDKKPVEKRIYNCSYVEVLAEDGSVYMFHGTVINKI